MKTKSKTPRTDRAVKDCYLIEGELSPLIEFCRELEIETISLKAKIEYIAHCGLTARHLSEIARQSLNATHNND
jgi:hypothetical protein